jgi:hypothetical protein
MNRPADQPVPPRSGLRAAVEHRSHVALVFLSGLPRWVLPVAMVALLIGSVLLPTVPAAVCLVLLLAALVWLSFLSWPVTDGRGRGLRVLVVALIALVGVTRVLD